MWEKMLFFDKIECVFAAVGVGGLYEVNTHWQVGDVERDRRRRGRVGDDSASRDIGEGYQGCRSLNGYFVFRRVGVYPVLCGVLCRMDSYGAVDNDGVGRC